MRLFSLTVKTVRWFFACLRQSKIKKQKKKFLFKNFLKIVLVFIIGVSAALFVDRFFGRSRPPAQVVEKKEIRIQENTALTEAVEKVAKTVVGVRTRPAGQTWLAGAGVFVTNDGLAVTLNRLLPQGEKFFFLLDGQPLSYQILKRDAKIDLVLVKLESQGQPTIAFVDPQKTKLGQRVFLLAYDFETGGRLVNEGVVSRWEKDFLQTNIIEKNPVEGSPLFDIEGNLVGLSFIDQDGRVSAIPVKQIKAFTGL